MQPDILNDALTAAASLTVVLVVILACARVPRGYFQRMIGRALRPDSSSVPARLCVRATVALDARRRVWLIEADGSMAVILTGGGQDLLMPWPPATHSQT